MKTYIKDIEKDEIRSGFLVTTDRKKIWQKEIELLLEIDRICREYDITYYASYGTMLGCARHKGFVPWDDDIDVVMFRPAYKKFIEVAMQEIRRPYFLQNIYTDSRIISWTKIMDDDTSAIEDWDADMHQGIFVDVFPMDLVPDGSTRTAVINEMMKALWMSVISPQSIVKALDNNENLYVSPKVLYQVLDMVLHDRMKTYEDFCLQHFEESEKIGFHMTYWTEKSKPQTRDAFGKVKYMDFEEIKVPMPMDYDLLLQELYGDWHTPVYGGSSHEGKILAVSADIPYRVMINDINKNLLDSKDYMWW